VAALKDEIRRIKLEFSIIFADLQRQLTSSQSENAPKHAKLTQSDIETARHAQPKVVTSATCNLEDIPPPEKITAGIGRWLWIDLFDKMSHALEMKQKGSGVAKGELAISGVALKRMHSMQVGCACPSPLVLVTSRVPPPPPPAGAGTRAVVG